MADNEHPLEEEEEVLLTDDFDAEFFPEEIDNYTEIETDLETEIESVVELDSELSGESASDAKNAENSEKEGQKLEREQEHTIEREQEQETTAGGADDLGDFDFDFPDDEVEEELGDGMDDYRITGESTRPIDEVIRDGSGESIKNLDLLEDLGLDAINFIDAMKAYACSALSGQEAALYTSDTRLKKRVIKAFKAYMSTLEVSAPTPFTTLLIAILLWGVPSFAKAGFHRFKLGKAGQKKLEEGEPAPTETKDFSHLKEYQEDRRVFSLNKTKQTYNRTPKGTFIAKELCNEFPSPEIQQLIDEGYDNKQIRQHIGLDKK